MELKHSGLGIASFVVSLAGGAALMGLIIAAGVIEATAPGTMDANSPASVFLGLLIIGSGGLDVVSAALGIASLFQTQRKKTFGVLGLVFSILTILGIGVLMVIGFAVSA